MNLFPVLPTSNPQDVVVKKTVQLHKEVSVSLLNSHYPQKGPSLFM